MRNVLFIHGAGEQNEGGGALPRALRAGLGAGRSAGRADHAEPRRARCRGMGGGAGRSPRRPAGAAGTGRALARRVADPQISCRSREAARTGRRRLHRRAILGAAGMGDRSNGNCRPASRPAFPTCRGSSSTTAATTTRFRCRISTATPRPCRRRSCARSMAAVICSTTAMWPISSAIFSRRSIAEGRPPCRSLQRPAAPIRAIRRRTISTDDCCERRGP